MPILIDRHTRVMTQGITGKSGRIHTALCRDYAYGRKCFVAGVNPRKPGQAVDGIPVFGSVKEAKAHTGANVSVIYVPPPFAAAAIDEAVDAELDLVICITRGVPVPDMVRTHDRMQGSKTILLGPNCPGIITPEELNIGILPNQVHQRGRIGVVSRTDTVSVEASRQLASFGLGESTVVGVGGDPVGGLQHIDVLRMFNDDPGTDAVIIVGEIGGEAEEQCAGFIKDHMHKPVIGFLSAPPGMSLARVIHVADKPEGMGELVASLVNPECLPFD